MDYEIIKNEKVKKNWGYLVRCKSGWHLIRAYKADQALDIEQIMKEESVTTKLITT